MSKPRFPQTPGLALDLRWPCPLLLLGLHILMLLASVVIMAIYVPWAVEIDRDGSSQREPNTNKHYIFVYLLLGLAIWTALQVLASAVSILFSFLAPLVVVVTTIITLVMWSAAVGASVLWRDKTRDDRCPKDSATTWRCAYWWITVLCGSISAASCIAILFMSGYVAYSNARSPLRKAKEVKTTLLPLPPPGTPPVNVPTVSRYYDSEAEVDSLLDSEPQRPISYGRPPSSYHPSQGPPKLTLPPHLDPTGPGFVPGRVVYAPPIRDPRNTPTHQPKRKKGGRKEDESKLMRHSMYGGFKPLRAPTPGPYGATASSSTRSLTQPKKPVEQLPPLPPLPPLVTMTPRTSQVGIIAPTPLRDSEVSLHPAIEHMDRLAGKEETEQSQSQFKHPSVPVVNAQPRPESFPKGKQRDYGPPVPPRPTIVQPPSAERLNAPLPQPKPLPEPKLHDDPEIRRSSSPPRVTLDLGAGDSDFWSKYYQFPNSFSREIRMQSDAAPLASNRHSIPPQPKRLMSWRKPVPQHPTLNEKLSGPADTTPSPSSIGPQTDATPTDCTTTLEKDLHKLLIPGIESSQSEARLAPSVPTHHAVEPVERTTMLAIPRQDTLESEASTEYSSEGDLEKQDLVTVQEKEDARRATPGAQEMEEQPYSESLTLPRHDLKRQCATAPSSTSTIVPTVQDSQETSAHPMAHRDRVVSAPSPGVRQLATSSPPINHPTDYRFRYTSVAPLTVTKNLRNLPPLKVPQGHYRAHSQPQIPSTPTGTTFAASIPLPATPVPRSPRTPRTPRTPIMDLKTQCVGHFTVSPTGKVEVEAGDAQGPPRRDRIQSISSAEPLQIQMPPIPPQPVLAIEERLPLTQKKRSRSGPPAFVGSKETGSYEFYGAESRAASEKWEELDFWREASAGEDGRASVGLGLRFAVGCGTGENMGKSEIRVAIGDEKGGIDDVGNVVMIW